MCRDGVMAHHITPNMAHIYPLEKNGAQNTPKIITPYSNKKFGICHDDGVKTGADSVPNKDC